ncbi:MAG: tol-pal system YbgF family protein [Kiritimatiellales bacterium]
MKFGITAILVIAVGVGVLGQDSAPAVESTETVSLEQALNALNAGDEKPAETLMNSMSNPAGKLYLQACLERAGGHPEAAIQLAARIVALHSLETEWLPRSELLCAELYLETGLTNAAAVTARQIQDLYEGTEISKKARALSAEIENRSGEAQE